MKSWLKYSCSRVQYTRARVLHGTRQKVCLVLLHVLLYYMSSSTMYHTCVHVQDLVQQTTVEGALLSAVCCLLYILHTYMYMYIHVVCTCAHSYRNECAHVATHTYITHDMYHVVHVCMYMNVCVPHCTVYTQHIVQLLQQLAGAEGILTALPSKLQTCAIVPSVRCQFFGQDYGTGPVNNRDYNFIGFFFNTGVCIHVWTNKSITTADGL